APRTGAQRSQLAPRPETKSWVGLLDHPAEHRDHLAYPLAVAGLLAAVQAEQALHLRIGLAVGPALVAGVAVELGFDDLRQQRDRYGVGQGHREVREVARRRLPRAAELDRERAADALGVAALLTAVFAQQLGGAGLADTVGEPVVEVLARAFDLEEQ